MKQYLYVRDTAPDYLSRSTHMLNSLARRQNVTFDTDGRVLVVDRKDDVVLPTEATSRMRELMHLLSAAYQLYKAGSTVIEMLALDADASYSSISRQLIAAGYPAWLAEPQVLMQLVKIVNEHKSVVHDAKQKTPKTDASQVAKFTQTMTNLGVYVPAEIPPFYVPESVVPLNPVGMPEGAGGGSSVGSTAGDIGGAVLGSILLPGIGTLLGGVLGGVIGGLFDSPPPHPNRDFWQYYYKGSRDGKPSNDQIIKRLNRFSTSLVNTVNRGGRPSWSGLVVPFIRCLKRLQVMTGLDFSEIMQHIQSVSPDLDAKMQPLHAMPIGAMIANDDLVKADCTDLGDMRYTDDVMLCEGKYFIDRRPGEEVLTVTDREANSVTSSLGRAAKQACTAYDTQAAAQSAAQLLAQRRAYKQQIAQQLALARHENSAKLEQLREQLQQAQQNAKIAKMNRTAELQRQQLQARIDALNASNQAVPSIPLSMMPSGPTQTSIAGAVPIDQGPDYSTVSGMTQGLVATLPETYPYVTTPYPYSPEGQALDPYYQESYAPALAQNVYPAISPMGYAVNAHYGGDGSGIVNEDDPDTGENYGGVLTFDNIAYDRCMCDECTSGRSFFIQDGTRKGEVYKSGLVDIKLADLPRGVYGRTFLDTIPYRIEIAPNVMPSRQRIALVHELMHALNDTYKLNLSHDQVHQLGVSLAAEVVPALKALQTLQNK